MPGGIAILHREFTSSYVAKFVIEKDRMYTENANRAVTGRLITPENLEPNPKNPLIASFFRNIGLADKLGSGMRNLYKYGKRYSGQPPEIVDGDVFRIIVPLDDNYSFDAHTDNAQVKRNVTKDVTKETVARAARYDRVISLIKENSSITTRQMAQILGVTLRTVLRDIAALSKAGKLDRVGGRKSGRWVINKEP